MNSEIKNIVEEFKPKEKKEIKREAKFINSKSYEVTLNNGDKLIREKLIKGGKDGSAVVILPVKEDNKIVVTIEPRVFTKTGVGISFPAGYIEEGEISFIAALRELEEETGLVPKELISLGGFYQDSGVSSAYNELFIALGCKCEKKQHLDKDEYIKYINLTYDEVLDLEKDGYINDCNGIIALTRAKKYLGK